MQTSQPSGISPELQTLLDLRRKHGFYSHLETNETQYRSGSNWSKNLLTQAGTEKHPNLPHQLTDEERTIMDGEGRVVGIRPKNAPILDFLAAKFAPMGFGWTTTSIPRNGKLQAVISFSNYPKVGGVSPSLSDLALMPPELADSYAKLAGIQDLLRLAGQKANFGPSLNTMSETGIGYSGIQGVSWRPGLQPFTLNKSLEEDLLRLGKAVFLLFDAIYELYEQDGQLTALINHKVPSRVGKFMLPGRVEVFRPDIVIVRNPDSSYRFVLTELESVPAGNGIFHAIQLGYGLPTDMLDYFIKFLNGRSYIVMFTHDYATFIWDQASFCAALRARGVDARIYLDKPLDYVHQKVQETWKPPTGAPPRVLAAWNPDFLGRLRQLGFDRFVFGAELLPESVGDSVVYRFAYLDEISPEAISSLINWQARGATVFNPLQFHLESKSLLAAVEIPTVRAWIAERDSEAVGILSRCIAETRLLHPYFAYVGKLIEDKNYWLTKYASWDGQNMSWGSRSIEVGAQHTPSTWERLLKQQSELAFPVIAQHLISSARFDVLYVDEGDRIGLLTDGRARLTPFFYKEVDGQVVHAGSIITFRSGTFRVHTTTDAVTTPVIFI